MHTTYDFVKAELRHECASSGKAVQAAFSETCGAACPEMMNVNPRPQGSVAVSGQTRMP